MLPLKLEDVCFTAGGRAITLEAEPRHVEVARANLARAGLSEIVELRLGRALETLPPLADGAPFDFVFIDADKTAYPEYFDWALRLTRPGSLIVADNVVRDGKVAARSDDPNVQGVQRLLARLAREPRVTATAVQTVGAKGYDGFAIVRVND